MLSWRNLIAMHICKLTDQPPHIRKMGNLANIGRTVYTALYVCLDTLVIVVIGYWLSHTIIFIVMSLPLSSKLHKQMDESASEHRHLVHILEEACVLLLVECPALWASGSEPGAISRCLS